MSETFSSTEHLVRLFTYLYSFSKKSNYGTLVEYNRSSTMLEIYESSSSFSGYFIFLPSLYSFHFVSFWFSTNGLIHFKVEWEILAPLLWLRQGNLHTQPAVNMRRSYDLRAGIMINESVPGLLVLPAPKDYRCYQIQRRKFLFKLFEISLFL